MQPRISVADLQQMKPAGRKIAGVVVYDYQMAQIVDRAGVDIVSVGDSVGPVLWGQAGDLHVTLDEMILACRAVRRGVARALVSCDCPYGPLQDGPAAAVRAARRLVDEGGADMVKLDDAASYPDAVRAVAEAGVPVWAQFGVTPHTTAAAAVRAPAETSAEQFVEQARLLEHSGAAMLDFTHSGPVAGPAAVAAVAIPVIGGLGGGPWLDGRVRSVFAAIGYLAAAIDDDVQRYANVARTSLEAVQTLVEDVRAGRHLRGQRAG